ncbi:hypothetical protein Bca4012_009366 [Brassica carinata]
MRQPPGTRSGTKDMTKDFSKVIDILVGQDDPLRPNNHPDQHILDQKAMGEEASQAQEPSENDLNRQAS